MDMQINSFCKILKPKVPEFLEIPMQFFRKTMAESVVVLSEGRRMEMGVEKGAGGYGVKWESFAKSKSISSGDIVAVRHIRLNQIQVRVFTATGAARIGFSWNKNHSEAQSSSIRPTPIKRKRPAKEMDDRSWSPQPSERGRRGAPKRGRPRVYTRRNPGQKRRPYERHVTRDNRDVKVEISYRKDSLNMLVPHLSAFLPLDSNKLRKLDGPFVSPRALIKVLLNTR